MTNWPNKKFLGNIKRCRIKQTDELNDHEFHCTFKNELVSYMVLFELIGMEAAPDLREQQAFQNFFFQ